MPDIDQDLRYLIRKAIVHLRKRYPDLWADPEVSGPLEQARRAADRLALMGRLRADPCRGRDFNNTDWREAA